jgi:hypothetical protein
MEDGAKRDILHKYKSFLNLEMQLTQKKEPA